MLEFATLFFGLPTLIYVTRVRVPAIPMLWVLMSYCLCILWRNDALLLAVPDGHGLRQSLPSILAIFLPFVVVTTALVQYFAPQSLFELVRTRRRLWLLVMIAYPLLSVYPQGIIYRAFFFFRYRNLFGSPWLLIAMSALAFAYVHVIFRNWLAVGLTAIGGLLFAMRYAQTGSVLVSSIEHALYGCWIFTVGLGNSFFYQARWQTEAAEMAVDRT